MSNYLRDVFIKNISLNEERLKKINDVFLELANSINNDLPDTDEGRLKTAVVNYVIRFDNKGYVLNDFDKVIKYHTGSVKTERIIFTLDTNEKYQSKPQAGKTVALRFDANDINNCTLVVQDIDANWVDATYCKIDEELNKYKNKNHLIKSPWTPFVVQILGVLAGFIISLWVALRVSPKLDIEYSFIVSFVLAFLVFSNVWTFLNQQILQFIGYLFPNISFKDSKGLHWLLKGLVSALFVGGALLLLSEVLIQIGLLFNELSVKQ